MRRRRSLACPDCARTIAVTDSPIVCPSCGDVGTVRNGVPSFVTPTRTGSTWLDERELARLVEAVEAEGIGAATDRLLDGHDYRHEVLGDLYDVNRDDWRILTADHVAGRCLDLTAGYGRRSLLLAELADEVYAVDPSLAKLRVLAARDDYDSARCVRPIHATADRLPFPDGAFDTVVADLTGPDDEPFRGRIARLRSYLREGGSLVLLVNGYSRRLGLPRRVGLERRPPIGRAAGPFATPGQYRSAMEGSGFDGVRVLALFPTARNVEYVFDVEDANARHALAASLFSGDGRRERLARTAMRVGNRLDLLGYGCPNYCVVGRRGGAMTVPTDAGSRPFTSPLLVAGRTRSVVLEFASGELAAIHKVPNRAGHAPTTERECRVVSELRSTGAPIAETLPEGRTVPSRFGTCRRETPAAGRSLERRLGPDVESFRRTLRAGYGWLAAFQRTFGGPTTTRSPAAVESDLSFPPRGLSPPSVEASHALFRTPVHGDYITDNVYASDGRVVGVIDWEYGARSGFPIVDAGSFLLNVAKRAVGSWDEGFEAVFRRDTEYARAAREAVGAYCARVGVRPRTFVRYLPTVYLHRMRLERETGATTTYTTKFEKRVDRIELLYDLDADALSPG